MSSTASLTPIAIPRNPAPPASIAAALQTTAVQQAPYISTNTTSSNTTSNSVIASDFSVPNFDIKSFINSQLADARTPSHAAASASTLKKDGGVTSEINDLVSTSSSLSSLLMKLQLLSADLTSSMEVQSQELVQAMPKALREIAFIQRESQTLRVNIADILTDMSTIEHTQPSATGAALAASLPAIAPATPITVVPASNSSTSPSPSSPPASTAASTIEFLQSIDLVKTRILRCTSTLEEIEKWTKRQHLVETLIERLTNDTTHEHAYTDILRIHQEIRSMSAILTKFAKLGVGMDKSLATARAASLNVLVKKREELAKKLLEQCIDALNTMTPNEITLLTSRHQHADLDPPPILKHFRILHEIYVDDRATFYATYQTSKLKVCLQKVVEKYQQSAPSSSSAVAAIPPPITGAATIPTAKDISHLDEWLPSFLQDLQKYIEREIALAECVLEDDAVSANKEEKLVVPVRKDSLFASTPTTMSTPKPAAISSATTSIPFISSSLLTTLSSVLSPLLTSWFTAYFATRKNSEMIVEVAKLWQIWNEEFVWNTWLMIVGDNKNQTAATQPSAHATSFLTFLLSPFSRYFQRDEYLQLERKSLLSSLDRMEFGGDSYTRLEENIEQVRVIMMKETESAVTRCQQLNGGILGEYLFTNLNEYYTEIIQRLFSFMRRLRRIAGLDGTQAVAAASTPSKSKNAPPSTSPPNSAAPPPAPLTKSQSLDAGSSGDGLGDLLQDAPTDITASSTTSAFSSFQGAFGLLRTCRVMQESLFATDRDHSILAQIFGANSAALVLSVIKEEQDKTPLKKGQVKLTAVVINSSTDLSRALALTCLQQAPDRLTAFATFLRTYWLPSHPLQEQSGASGSTTQGTQGLYVHTVTTPSATKVRSVSTPNPADSSSPTSSTSLFATSSQLYDSFISAVHNLILDLMFQPIQRTLNGFPEWSAWVAKQATGLSSLVLPTFSMQPSEYVVTIGEHLLSLVHQMEPYVKSNEDVVDGASTSPTTVATYQEHDAFYWLQLLARGTFKHLISLIHQLTVLSDRGAQQLACDLEYLVNVLQALGLTIPGTITKLQAWLTQTETQIMQHIQTVGDSTPSSSALSFVDTNSGAENYRIDSFTSQDKQMLRTVIRARRFKTMEMDKSIQAHINA